MAAKVVAAVVDPGAQVGPRAQQRLVGDLDSGRTREPVGIERQQPVTAEDGDDILHRHRIDIQGQDLGRLDPAAGVVIVFGDGHQAEEQLTGSHLLVRRQLPVQVSGTTAQRPLDTVHRAVRGGQHHIAGPAVEQLGQCVLEQREGARLAADIGEQVSEQSRLE